MARLEQNTLEGITFGLENFDGAETDLRLTQDNELVIFHDNHLDGKLIEHMYLEETRVHNIPSLRDLLNHKAAMDLVNQGRQLWLEPKCNCRGKQAITKPITEVFYNAFVNVMDGSHLLAGSENINILGFYHDMLEPFAREGIYRAYPIVPAISECRPMRHRMMVGFFSLMKTSLKTQIQWAVEQNYGGLMFANQYLLSAARFRHPNYEQIVDLMDEYQVELGTMFFSREMEEKYPKFHRFTDNLHPFPRYARPGEGKYIAHRGASIHGVEL